jgi:hypothetical protein
LACVPILQIDQETIKNCLAKYNVSEEKARSRLLNFYSILLRHFLKNNDISKEEFERLVHLQKIFNLTTNEINTIHQTFTRPVYVRHIIKSVSDGVLTENEKDKLNKLAVHLRISKAEAKNLYVNEASKYLHSVLKTSLEDGMLSEGEERELERIARNLQVDLKFSENARQNLARCRYLWHLHNGKLPKIDVKIYLARNETCAARVPARHFELSNQFHLVKYSGYNELRGQYGREFHSGRVPTNRVAGKSMHLLDSGILYFTNQRILFNGTNGTKQFLFVNLIGGSFYKNGMLLEQETGRDQFFEFKGDIEALRLIFDALMTKSRQ